jgi:N-dimethylarginine dimethylaminohydrolase
LPDLVFTDAGFLYRNYFIPSNFRFSERWAEADVFAKWFEEDGYNVHRIDPELYFEGHGDDLWVNPDTVYCGYGFRSLKVAFEHIRNLFSEIGTINMKLVELTDPRFYHLDTCFTPLRENLALIYKPGVADESIKMIQEDMELIEMALD